MEKIFDIYKEAAKIKEIDFDKNRIKLHCIDCNMTIKKFSVGLRNCIERWNEYIKKLNLKLIDKKTNIVEL